MFILAGDFSSFFACLIQCLLYYLFIVLLNNYAERKYRKPTIEPAKIWHWVKTVSKERHLKVRMSKCLYIVQFQVFLLKPIILYIFTNWHKIWHFFSLKQKCLSFLNFMMVHPTKNSEGLNCWRGMTRNAS